MSEQADYAGEGEWKNIAASQARPDLREPGHAFIVRRSSEIAGVDRTDRRANHEIRVQSSG